MMHVISCLERTCLPIFLVRFHNALGKLYSKKQFWHLAAKEVENAQRILKRDSNLISCSKCRLILGATTDQHSGDFNRNTICFSHENKHECLSKAKLFYKSVEEKLKSLEWENCASKPKEAVSGNEMLCDSDLSGWNIEVENAQNKLKEIHDCIVSLGVANDSSLRSVIQLKWELSRRRLLIKVLARLGIIKLT